MAARRHSRATLIRHSASRAAIRALTCSSSDGGAKKAAGPEGRNRPRGSSASRVGRLLAATRPG
jgi:hypothetical protein